MCIITLNVLPWVIISPLNPDGGYPIAFQYN